MELGYIRRIAVNSRPALKFPLDEVNNRYQDKNRAATASATPCRLQVAEQLQIHATDRFKLCTNNFSDLKHFNIGPATWRHCRGKFGPCSMDKSHASQARYNSMIKIIEKPSAVHMWK
jgi:hypothetical protein